MTPIVAIAVRLAANAPDATLACPVCGTGLKGVNLERHLDRVHPGQPDGGTSWRGLGWRGGRLEWDAGVLRWRSRTGLRRRTVTHVAGVAAGTTLSASGSEHVDRERSGAYVQVHGEGGHVTVRCPSGASARRAWAGWTPGPRVTRWQITLDVTSFVALLYVLVEADVLRPAPDLR